MKKSKIGGQAVIEGVMMRGATSGALSCRDQKNRIRTKTWRLSGKKSVWRKIPIIRGVINFVLSITEGVKTLMSSAEVFGEEEPTKAEKWFAKTFKIDLMKVVTVFALLLGIALAVGLFIVLPTVLAELIAKLFSLSSYSAIIWIEAGLKILILFMYIYLTSLLKDIRRVYMYHGAEHKTINCYENDMELTPENVMKCKKFHNRCGTTFLFFVILVSILVTTVLRVENPVYRVLVKTACLPLVAGIAYELLMVVANTKFFLFYPLRLPGMLLQKLTTREPTIDMVEVALKSFKAVLELDENPELETYDNFTFRYADEVIAESEKTLKKAGVEFDADVKWIISSVCKVKRSSIAGGFEISMDNAKKIKDIVADRATGKPLWYILKETNFYGVDIMVDERALIPRPETESLVELAIKNADPNGKVLDLCTGSGAIAVALSKNTRMSVTASDISEKAISLAKENAEKNSADISFVLSDMFEKLEGEKFDCIISNPPYIKREDIEKLQREVKDFEPMNALDGGEDGLDFYRLIASEGKKYLNEKGIILVEVGFDQASVVMNLFAENGFFAESHKDLMGIDRVVIARLSLGENNV